MKKNSLIIFSMLMLTALCFMQRGAWANACYKPCKTNQECQNTCGKVWYCSQKEGYCLPHTESQAH